MEMTEPSTDTRRRRFTRTMVLSGSISTLLYVPILWNFSLSPLRTALNGGVFANFFDVQARAFLRGDLALPHGSLAIEGFIHDGREYTYFPPLPALLRIPFLLLTDRYDGQLTAPSILVAWFVTLVFTAMLLWRVRELIRPGADLHRWELVAYGFVYVAMTAGSVILFLASMPWVFHEVYAWAIALSVITMYCFLGVLERPTGRRIVATGAAATGAILTRTTAGWAFSLAIIAAAAWYFVRRRSIVPRRLSVGLAAAGGIALVIGSSVNYAKFRHPFMFPLKTQVWTQLNEHRRDALAANGGDLVSPDLFWSTTVNYLRPDGIRFTGVFPFITMPPEAAHSYGGGFIDQAYRTGSVTAFMPLLVLLCAWGLWTAFRPRRHDDHAAREAIAVTRFPLIGAAAILGGILFYGYLAHRYTCEFMPLLILGSAVGLTDLVPRIGARSRRARRAAITAIAALSVFAVAANTATAFSTERLANPGRPLQEYVRLQRRISANTGHPLDTYVRRADALPTTGRADQLQIVGDCRALYLGTGDTYGPWVPVEVRGYTMELTPLPSPEPSGSTVLVRFTGWRIQDLVAEWLGPTSLRLSITSPQGTAAGPWIELDPVAPRTVSIEADLKTGQYFTYVNGELLLAVAMNEWDPDWFSAQTLLDPVPIDTINADQSAFVARPIDVPPLEMCTGFAGVATGA